jgi:predicted ATPase
VTRLELGALTREEADALLGLSLAAHEASALYDDSGGNPFYLEQLARMRERGGAASAAAAEGSLGGVPVPPIVAAAVSEELGVLSAEARLVLEGASVAGDPFDPELAGAAAGTTERATMTALDELLRLELVRPTEVPRRFRFRHPLVRRSVYEGTPGGWRLGAHERVSDTLLERVPGRRRGHTTSSAPRDMVMPPRSRR